MSAQPTLEDVEALLGPQISPAPPIDDVNEKQARYVFNPFRDKTIPHIVRSEWGLTKLRARLIQPIYEFDLNETHYGVIKDVEDGDLTATMGVSEKRNRKRPPLRVMDSMKRYYSMKRNLPTGFGEIACLRGMERDRLRLVMEIQAALLPPIANAKSGREFYYTAGEQFRALDSAALTGKPQEFGRARDELLGATVTAITWCEMAARQCVSQMEDYANGVGGLREPSQFDLDVFAWLEMAVPKMQPKLVQQGAQQSTIAKPERATVQCQDCGTEAKLLDDGSLPRKGCIVCKSPTFGREAEVATESFNPDDPMGEKETARKAKLEREQKEMQQRNKGK